MNIVLSGTSERKLSLYQKRLETEYHGRCAILSMNLEDSISFDEKIKNASSFFGSIDIFVHCAGVHTENVNFWTMTESGFDRVMNINLKGTYFMCQAMARYFVQNNIKGKILLISSSRGTEPAQSPYGISKWGINGMVKGLGKLFLQHGITINAIAPRFCCDTDARP